MNSKSKLAQRLALTLLLAFSLQPLAFAQTPVLFNTYNFTGQVLNNPITVTPLDSLVSDSQNLYAGPPVTLQPVAGIAATNLMPGDYRVVIQGIGKAWTITVPVSTTPINAAAIPKLGVLSQNVFFWTNALAGVNLTLNFTNDDNQFRGVWLGNNGSLAVSTNGGWRQFPVYAPFPSPFFFSRSIGLGDWGPSSLNDLAGDTILMAGTNNVLVIRDSAGNDLAYFSSTNTGGAPKLSLPAGGLIAGNALAGLSVPNELWVNTTNGSDANSGTNWSTAKATLLGAYDALSPDGGTIHFADGSWVGSNSGQGIWLMGSNDPNWGQAGYPGNGTPVGANGWRAVKGMTRWVGHGGTSSSQWGFPAIANLLGGAGAWVLNTNKPALWFSDCSQGISFENVLINNCPYPLRIGPNSALSGVTFCSQFWFANCTLRCPNAATDDGHSGPTAWFETSEAAHFQNCNFQSYTTADGSLVVTNSRHAAILCNVMPNALYGAGNFKITDSSFFGGGIKYYTPQTGVGGFMLDNDVLECGSYALCPPLAWIIGSTYYYVQTTIRNCVMWDGYFWPGLSLVQIDSPDLTTQAPPDTVLSDTLLVNGPATIINNSVQQTGMPTNQPSAQRQVGIAKGRFWGMTDAFRRNFAPATVILTNMVRPGLPANCTNAPDPAGATNAFASTVVGAGPLSISLARPAYGTLSAGDCYIFGAWVKLSGSSPVSSDAGNLFLSSGDGTMAFDNGSSIVRLPLPFDHNDWQWLSTFSRVANPGAGSSTMIFAARYYQNRTATIYAPVLMYVPAGTMDTNSIAEIANHLSSAPPLAQQGSLPLIPGQQLGLYDTNTGTWYYLGVTNGQLTVSSASAFTNLTVTTPAGATRSMLFNGQGADGQGGDAGGLSLVLNHNQTGNRQLLLGDSATGYALRVLPQTTVYLDGYLLGTGEQPLEFQSSGSPAIFGGPVTVAAFTNTDAALAGASVLGMDAHGKMIVGSTSGGATFTLNTNGTLMNATTATLGINAGTGIQLSGPAAGSSATLTITATGAGGMGQTNSPVVSASSTITITTNLSTPGATNYIISQTSAQAQTAIGAGVYDASGAGTTAALNATNGTAVRAMATNAAAAVTNNPGLLQAALAGGASITNNTTGSAASVLGGSGPGLVIVPNGAGNPGILLGGTNAGISASNIVANTVAATNGFTGNLTGTASGNDAAGAALNATNGAAAWPSDTASLNATNGLSGATLTAKIGAGVYDASGAGTTAALNATNGTAVLIIATNAAAAATNGAASWPSDTASLNATNGLSGATLTAKIGAGVYDVSGAALNATNGQTAAQLVAQIGTTPVARATGDGSGNSISGTYATQSALQSATNGSGNIPESAITSLLADLSSAAKTNESRVMVMSGPRTNSAAEQVLTMNVTGASVSKSIGTGPNVITAGSMTTWDCSYALSTLTTNNNLTITGMANLSTTNAWPGLNVTGSGAAHSITFPAGVWVWWGTNMAPTVAGTIYNTNWCKIVVEYDRVTTNAYVTTR